MFCKKCGKEIAEGTKFCPNCGANQEETKIVFESDNSTYYGPRSRFSRGLALLLSLIGCVGISGIHRLYVGKIGTGILWILTGGCFGIGTLVDIIMIALGSFKDADGNPLIDWNF